jgi:hypothetical protein
MTLKVIGAGFGRTGTMSMKQALERLGFGPCHHMEEVFANPDQVSYWEAAARGESVDWNEVFRNYNSAVDWPSAHFWRELTDFYPDAKVLLTSRSSESWWASFSETIGKVLNMSDEIPNPHLARVTRMAHELIANQTFNGKMLDRDVAIAAYEQRIADVKAKIPADRLLMFNFADGWAPLCEFLGCEIPEGEFPRSNSIKEFWQHFGP